MLHISNINVLREAVVYSERNSLNAISSRFQFSRSVGRGGGQMQVTGLSLKDSFATLISH
jgi:hypothetical protein